MTLGAGELGREEIAKLLRPHHEAGDEGHCAGCDKPKPKYAPSPCHTSRALTMALALLDLRERIETRCKELFRDADALRDRSDDDSRMQAERLRILELELRALTATVPA